MPPLSLKLRVRWGSRMASRPKRECPGFRVGTPAPPTAGMGAEEIDAAAVIDDETHATSENMGLSEPGIVSSLSLLPFLCPHQHHHLDHDHDHHHRRNVHHDKLTPGAGAPPAPASSAPPRRQRVGCRRTKSRTLRLRRGQLLGENRTPAENSCRKGTNDSPGEARQGNRASALVTCHLPFSLPLPFALPYLPELGPDYIYPAASYEGSSHSFPLPISHHHTVTHSSPFPSSFYSPVNRFPLHYHASRKSRSRLSRKNATTVSTLTAKAQGADDHTHSTQHTQHTLAPPRSFLYHP